MSDEASPALEAARRMTRCPQGHIFNAAAAEVCPVCGERATATPPQASGTSHAAAPASTDPAAARNPASESPAGAAWLTPAIASGAALVVALLVAVIIRGAPVADNTEISSPADAKVNPDDSPAPEGVNKPRFSGAAVAGLWEIYVPNPQGLTARWTLEFTSDGSYRFSDESNGASHSGSYQSSGGSWTLSGKWTSSPFLATGTPFEDNGTYRMLDAETMELSGRYGAGVWRRASSAH